MSDLPHKVSEEEQDKVLSYSRWAIRILEKDARERRKNIERFVRWIELDARKEQAARVLRNLHKENPHG